GTLRAHPCGPPPASQGFGEGAPGGRPQRSAMASARRRPRTGAYEPVTASGVQQMVRFLGRAGLGRPVHPHLFRHTYISKLVRKGIDSTVIRRYVGHTSSLLIDRTYGHLRPQDTASMVLAALRD